MLAEGCLLYTSGWAYDEDDECWYHAAEDGELTKGWLHAGGAWYWFDSKYKMYNRGYRMVDAHKYYFYENGQMAANQYVEMNYYDENGLRDKQYDITIQGKRRPTAEEKKGITEEMCIRDRPNIMPISAGLSVRRQPTGIPIWKSME